MLLLKKNENFNFQVSCYFSLSHFTVATTEFSLTPKTQRQSFRLLKQNAVMLPSRYVKLEMAASSEDSDLHIKHQLLCVMQMALYNSGL